MYSLTARLYYNYALCRSRELFRRLRHVERSQFWPSERIEASSFQKARDMAIFSYECVPYYRLRFDQAGVDPRAISGVNAFLHIPVLRKQDVQTASDRLLATGSNRAELRLNHTGGSTGHLLSFYQDRHYLVANAADKLLTYDMCGHKPGMRWAFLWGSDYDAPGGRWEDLRRRIELNCVWINTFGLDWSKLASVAKVLSAFRPKFIVGYVSSLILLSQYLSDRGLRLDPIAIQSSAETLTLAQRRQLESVFHAPVFDRYGCREVGNVAQECEAHDGLHILGETNFVEIIREDGQRAEPGETGRIIVTNLTNSAFPFIRYDTGDLGVAGNPTQCACGRSLPKIIQVKGRSSDVIVSPEGRLLHGEFFTHLFYGVKGVRQFQVVQHDRKRIVISIVRSPGFEEDELNKIRDLVFRCGSPHFSLDFEFPDSIAASSSGKHRFTISLIPHELFPPSEIDTFNDSSL